MRFVLGVLVGVVCALSGIFVMLGHPRAALIGASFAIFAGLLSLFDKENPNE